VEHPFFGQQSGVKPKRGRPDLAQLRAATARSDTFKLSTDPWLVEKVWDIVGLSLNPPEHAIVLCVDEKTQVQALDRTQPILPLRPGLPEQREPTITSGMARRHYSPLWISLPER
jgi:hypothetical protein